MKKISKKKSDELNKLVSIDKIRRVIEILRDPDGGCPWDLKQDYSSIAPYSIEEAYELVNAIEKNDINEIKSELGEICCCKLSLYLKLLLTKVTLILTMLQMKFHKR